jgi:hypothetical protein
MKNAGRQRCLATLEKIPPTMNVKNPFNSRKITMNTYATGDVKYATQLALGDGLDVA